MPLQNVTCTSNINLSDDLLRIDIPDSYVAIISTHCPTIVDLIERHYPQLLRNLMGVVSPMVAIGRFIKARTGKKTRVVYISSCIAGKFETEAEPVAGAPVTWSAAGPGVLVLGDDGDVVSRIGAERMIDLNPARSCYCFVDAVAVPVDVEREHAFGGRQPRIGREQRENPRLTGKTRNEYVDIIVPRGGKELIERLSRESRIPMIKHLDGVCHVYVDDSADADMAVKIADNAKTQRYGTCNTMETLLVARGIAERVLPPLSKVYRDKGIELRGDAEARRIVPGMKPATEEDWYTEYLDAILSVRVVKDMGEAIEHIAVYGSQHTDAIVTQDKARAKRFLREVDSSSVMWNASTRFADGYEYGLGADIGISTDKLPARGPVGLEGLTTQKFVVLGHGEVRS